ncbi:hypothetical protein GGS23DRAFT_558493 [Durotheca rogersii]|uniref:uncharacterized protein n=1 Tax=Durotheca rogersii TaxID=419775 RepID=UPI002220D306|nr:uncharacterized protein GGS23DRAFT_558493 [Durotheca rogersii]KAI5865272.1 hypothetical protein GGS23DRAFT_558493 [Durotheca rogersii]
MPPVDQPDNVTLALFVVLLQCLASLGVCINSRSGVMMQSDAQHGKGSPLTRESRFPGGCTLSPRRTPRSPATITYRRRT